MKTIKTFKDRSQHYTQALKEEFLKKKKVEVNKLWLETECAVFSDNFVFSMPASTEARVISVIGEICRDLLSYGFLSRGGVTIGDLYHKENFIFGPALNEAVALEKEAIFPRVLCSDKLLEAAKEWGVSIDSYILADSLGRNIVNLFVPQFIINSDNAELLNDFLKIDEINSFIEVNEIACQKENNNKNLEKWRYLKNAKTLMLQRSNLIP